MEYCALGQTNDVLWESGKFHQIRREIMNCLSFCHALAGKRAFQLATSAHPGPSGLCEEVWGKVS